MLCVTPRNSSVMSVDHCRHRCWCSEVMIKTASAGINLVTISWFWKQVPHVSSLVIPHDRSPRQRGNSWRLWHHEAFEARTQQTHTHAQTHTNHKTSHWELTRSHGGFPGTGNLRSNTSTTGTWTEIELLEHYFTTQKKLLLGGEVLSKSIVTLGWAISPKIIFDQNCNPQ